MKKWIILSCIILSITLAAILIVSLKSDSAGSIKSTNNIAYYDSGAFLVPNTVFPKSIPDNAQVVSYSHYVFWSSAEDVYLELKFNALEEMQTYLAEVKEECIANISKNKKIVPNETFLERQNIYDAKYKEMISTDYLAWCDGEFYTGYEITVDTESTEFDCIIGLISYCVDDLTVIHTYTNGTFLSNKHKNYVPMYFKRFDVPIDQNHKRIYTLQDDGSFFPTGH